MSVAVSRVKMSADDSGTDHSCDQSVLSSVAGCSWSDRMDCLNDNLDSVWPIKLRFLLGVVACLSRFPDSSKGCTYSMCTEIYIYIYLRILSISQT